VTVPVVRFVYGDQEAPSAGSTRRYTLVYDGACTVCGRLVSFLERWDRHGVLEIVPSQRADVQARFPWIPAAAYEESVQLVGPGGRTWQGAGAIEQLLRVLPRGRALAWLFRIPLVGPIVDRFYFWFARNRYRFGCGEHCQYRPLNVSYGDGAEDPPLGADAAGAAPEARSG
jgi:predicted DCC family thiol-disulfide oxidoreductase YuxK